MSNKNLSSNTASLQAILDKVNALPDAGSGELNLQSKTVSPTTSQQTVKPDSGYDGLSQVTVNAMPTATQAAPTISVSSGGLITASSTQTAGYVASGTKSATSQLSTQAAKTITPSTSSQTAVASGKYTTGAITVAAIPSTYVKPTYTKAATTYTPSTSNQTIAAKTYCTGIQTIKGDANLKAENIAEGVSIFGVTGTHSGGSSGGGGGIETCTISLVLDAPTLEEPTVYYVSSDMTLKNASFVTTSSITVIKNTIIYIQNWSSVSDAFGNASQINYSDQTIAYFVSGDCTLVYMG